MDDPLFDYYQERQENTEIIANEAVDNQVIMDEEEENADPSLISWENLSGNDSRMKILTGVTCNQFLVVYDLVFHVMPVIIGRGKRSRISHHDKLIMTLCFLKHYETLDKLKETFHLSKSYISEIINGTIDRISPVLYEHYIEKYEPTIPDELDDFPEARYIIDVTFQPIWTPLGTYNEKKRFYSGKHKQYGLKTQCIHDRTGHLLHCIAGVPGSVHDLTIIRQIDEDIPQFSDTEETKKINDLLSRDLMEEDDTWTVLVDLGYQGLQHHIRVILPHRKQPGREFTREERDHNRKVSRNRVVCEHFYGRLKSKWRIMATKYRNDHGKYSTIFKLCCALTSMS